MSGSGGNYFPKPKRVCPYCEKTFTPEHRKQITCGSYPCKVSRIYHLRSMKQEAVEDKIIYNHARTKPMLLVKKQQDVARMGHDWGEVPESYSEDFV